MKPLSNAEVEELPYGTKYVMVEIRQVGQSQGLREDYTDKTLYFALTDNLLKLLNKKK